MPKDSDPNWGQFAGIGLQVGIGVALGVIVGRWLDDRYNWSPWGVVVGSMLGLAGGLYLLIRDGMRINKD